MVKQILEQAAREPKLDMETARKIAEDFRSKFKGREFPDVVESVRKERARWAYSLSTRA